MSTTAETHGESSWEPALPTLVNARALPAGSHLPISGATLDRIPISITIAQAIPPTIAVTVLRVRAPSATPSSPNSAVETVAPTQSWVRSTGSVCTPREAYISIASTHGVVGIADRSTYGIAKAGIIQMTRMLAIEWARHGIRVNAVAPGTVETPSRAAVYAADPQRREFMINRVPLRRFGTAEEMAAAVCYLASSRAAYITGQTLLVDGGLTAY